MAKGRNIIRKQILNFQYHGKTEPLSLQKEVSDWCMLSLIPEIEQRLESFGLGEVYFSIDKLEIEAIIEGTDWKKKLKDRLIKDMESQLGDFKSSPDKAAIHAKSVTAKIGELMLFYFQNGYLPWWGKTLIEIDFEALLLKWLDNLEADTGAEVLNKQLKEIMAPAVIERMVNIIPRRYFFQLLSGIYKKEKVWIASLETFYNGSVEKNLSKENQKVMLQLIFKWVAVSDNNESIKREKILYALFEEIYEQTGILPSGKEAYPLKMLATSLKKDASILKTKLSLKDEKEWKKSLSDIKVDKRFPITEMSEEGVYIENAGAIIIAPFLPALFKKLSLTQEAKILDFQTAILAIQYAIIGNGKVEEYDLVLPKILCGLDVDFVIDASMEISGEQKNEVDEMLSSLIEYWSVLKNTSIQGLQETFLRRAGKLSTQENDWLLQVEQKSYDMLLNQLPYNISMIKLPWMKGIVRTEWV